MGIIRNFIKGTDHALFWLCVFVSAFGVLLVYSATLSKTDSGQLFSRDVIVMAAAVVLGLLLCLVISWFDYEAILRFWFIIAGVSILLMLLLFVFGTGPSERSDVRTWLPLRLGSFSLFFQPSELLKFAFIITFSLHLDYVGSDINRPLNLLLLGVHAAIPTLLVVVTGDLGSAIVFVMIFGAMMFIANVKLRYFILAGAAALAAVPLVWVKVFNDIQRDRFLALIYPDNYPDIIYQQKQGRIAMGTGGLFGSGLFEGLHVQNGLVPEAKNDMILAVAGEELGFIGCMALMLMFLFIILRIVRTARYCVDVPGKMLCCGVAAMIASQLIVNVGMCLMLLPVIGITLPFVSAGGSSNLCVYLAMGLVFSVYRHNIERTPVDFRIISVIKSEV